MDSSSLGIQFYISAGGGGGLVLSSIFRPNEAELCHVLLESSLQSLDSKHASDDTDQAVVGKAQCGVTKGDHCYTTMYDIIRDRENKDNMAHFNLLQPFMLTSSNVIGIVLSLESRR